MKRFLAGLLVALVSLSALGTTLNPIQGLNPAGSTSGQVVASTGASTPPAWTTVTLSGLGGIVGIANGGTGQTTQSAALTAILGSSAIPIANGGTGQASQSAALTALLGSSAVPVANGGTGVTTAAAELARIGAGATASPLSQFAATTSAQLATILTDETGTGANVFGTAPTISQPNIVGVTGASNAAVGSVGEYLSSTGSSTGMTSGISINLNSVSLTGGDYDVTGVVYFSPAGTTTMTQQTGSISTTTGTVGTLGTYASLAMSAPAGQGSAVTLPTVRESLASTTTVFCVGLATFGVSTAAATCVLRWRRIR